MAASKELGTELRALRVARGLTLVEAARRAGVSRVSLHRWEVGENAPGAAALLRLLEGLGAEARDRARLVGSADPHHTQAALKDDPLGPLAHPGHVLRALREARGLTQADLARQVGIGQPAVARWESGHATPGEATLARALAALGALDIGLREDTLDLYDPLTDPLDARLRLREVLDRMPYSRFLLAHLSAMERELWPLAAHEPRWEAALVETMATRSHVLVKLGEFTAGVELARRALRLAEGAGEWDAASNAFHALYLVRWHRGTDFPTLARYGAEILPRLCNPFVRASWLGNIAADVADVDPGQSRTLVARCEGLVREGSPDELFGKSKFALSESHLAPREIMLAVYRGDVEEAARSYERSSAHRWEHEVRHGPLDFIYVLLHRKLGERPSEQARAALYETWSVRTGYLDRVAYNEEIAPWIGTDPLPVRPPR